MGYKIGSFNLRNIGTTALGNKNERDLKKIAEIIKKEGFDVVALQEILSEGKAFISPDFAKHSILMELGPDWDFKWADSESELDSRHEGYAFLWNKRKLCLPVVTLDDGTQRTFYPRICRLNRKVMKRRPYYARFTSVGTPVGGPYMELRLLCIHTYYGKDTANDRKERYDEIDAVLTDIYPQVVDRVYMGNMPHYTIVLGDYNAELWRPWKDAAREKENLGRVLQGKSKLPKPAMLRTDADGFIESTRWGHRRILTVQDQRTTLKAKDKDGQLGTDFEGRGYAHDYDHFSFEENVFKGVKMNVQRIDAVRKYCQDDFEKYLKTVSDHIPIMMSIELK